MGWLVGSNGWCWCWLVGWLAGSRRQANSTRTMGSGYSILLAGRIADLLGSLGERVLRAAPVGGLYHLEAEVLHCFMRRWDIRAGPSSGSPSWLLLVGEINHWAVGSVYSVMSVRLGSCLSALKREHGLDRGLGPWNKSRDWGKGRGRVPRLASLQSGGIGGCRPIEGVERLRLRDAARLCAGGLAANDNDIRPRGPA